MSSRSRRCAQISRAYYRRKEEEHHYDRVGQQAMDKNRMERLIKQLEKHQAALREARADRVAERLLEIFDRNSPKTFQSLAELMVKELVQDIGDRSEKLFEERTEKHHVGVSSASPRMLH